MKIERIVGELLPGEEFKAVLEIPEETVKIGQSDMYVCNLFGLEDFRDDGNSPFSMVFSSVEDATEWFFSKFGILDFIDREAHC